MRFSNYYYAKFARQEKPQPTHWLIRCDGPTHFELVQIAGFTETCPDTSNFQTVAGVLLLCLVMFGQPITYWLGIYG